MAGSRFKRDILPISEVKWLADIPQQAATGMHVCYHVVVNRLLAGISALDRR
jgi:hypothetical protein